MCRDLIGIFTAVQSVSGLDFVLPFPWSLRVSPVFAMVIYWLLIGAGLVIVMYLIKDH